MLKPAAEQLLQKAVSLSGEPDILQQIQAACHRNQACIFHTADDNGIIALKLIRDSDGTTGVWIWIAASTGGHLSTENFAELCKLAHMANAGFIAFRTRRRGLIRRAEKFGFIRQPDDDDGFMTARCWLNKQSR